MLKFIELSAHFPALRPCPGQPGVPGRETRVAPTPRPAENLPSSATFCQFQSTSPRHENPVLSCNCACHLRRRRGVRIWEADCHFTATLEFGFGLSILTRLSDFISGSRPRPLAPPWSNPSPAAFQHDGRSMETESGPILRTLPASIHLPDTEPTAIMCRAKARLGLGQAEDQSPGGRDSPGARDRLSPAQKRCRERHAE